MPHCLETIFDLQLPSPELSPETPPKLSLAPKRGHFSSFKITPVLRVIARQVRDKNCLAAIFCSETSPKDPAVLKILRVANLLRVVFLVRRGDLLSRSALCGHQFPGNYRHFSSQGRVRGVLNLGGVVKTVRRSNSLFKFCYRRSIFSTEGSFGSRFRRTQEGWRSWRRKSSSVPEGGADFPAAIFLARDCPNLGKDSISQRAQRSKKFDLDRNFQSRPKILISLENFNLDVSISPQKKIGPRWVARSKISFSLEIFNLARNLEFFLIFGFSGFVLPENQGIIFQQRRTLPENFSSNEFRTATAFSSFLNNVSFGPLVGCTPKGSYGNTAF